MAAISSADFLAALKEKSSLGEASGIRPWIIGGGGAFNGAYLAGVQWPLAGNAPAFLDLVGQPSAVQPSTHRQGGGDEQGQEPGVGPGGHVRTRFNK